MKTVNCGCNLQTGTKIIAIIQIIGSVLHFIDKVILMVSYSKMVDSIHDEYEQFRSLGNVKGEVEGWILLSVMLITAVLSFTFGILLLRGAHKRDLGKIRIWFMFSSIIVVLHGLSVATKLAVMGDITITVNILSLIISICCLVIVYLFQVELHRETQTAIYDTV